MEIKTKIYRRQQQVRSYDIDENLELKLNVIFQWFSEIAWEHAKTLGIGFEELKNVDKFWVLNSVNVEINKLPKWQDQLILETYPAEFQAYNTLANFNFMMINKTY